MQTIGQGNRTIEEFMALLKASGARILVDVRSRPFSWRPEFSQPSLKAAVEAVGLSYRYMGEGLGGQPEDPSLYVNGFADYARMGDRPAFRIALEAVIAMDESEGPVSLFCAEAKPEECHRSRLIGRELARRGVDVLHIDENGDALPHGMLVLRLMGGQLGILGLDELPDRSSRRIREDSPEEDR